MVEGFWIVQYEGVAGNGGGVVLFMRGRVLGGDTGYVYTGTYEERGDELRAQVAVRNFLPEIVNVAGFVGDFELAITGKIEGGLVKGTAALVGQPNGGILIKLTRVSDLPA